MSSSRATFLLVHGAWWGAWVWHKLIPLLEEAGHQVLAPDLPGAGLDRTPLATVTFASAVNRLLDLVDRANNPVIFVGHGLGGVLISQAAEERPEKVRHLVYLTALLPKNDEAALAPQTTFTRQGHPLFPCVEMDEMSASLRFDSACSFWYHDCSPTDMLLAERYLRPQALAIVRTPVVLSRRFETLPRTYLACRYDRVLEPAAQARWVARITRERVLWLPSGHMPALSIPIHLAMHLNRLAQHAPSSARGRPPRE